MSGLRGKSPPKTWTTHQVPDAHLLERAASFGGRASVWYYGNVGAGCGQVAGPFARWEGTPVPGVPGPVTQVDMRQMYGSVMLNQQLPHKLITVRDNPSVREVMQSCERNGVIARVRIRTSRAEYPYRAGSRVVYPLGTFTTTLTGVELLELSKHGELLECYQMALYRIAPAANAYAAWLTDPSTRERCAKAVSTPSFPKLLLNSIVGKLGQKPGRWVRSPQRDEPGRWGEGSEVSLKTDRTTRVRWVAGLAFAWDDDETQAGPFAAAFAYIAAWGRVLMARLRSQLPARVCVSQDTDGLWILGSNNCVRDMVAGWVGEAPGQLRIEGSADSARWYSPRHYYVDGRWVLSGLHFQPGNAASPEAWSSVTPSLWATRTNRAPTETFLVNRKVKLRCDVSLGRLGRDGWCEPPEVRPSRSGDDGAGS